MGAFQFGPATWNEAVPLTGLPPTAGSAVKPSLSSRAECAGARERHSSIT